METGTGRSDGQPVVGRSPGLADEPAVGALYAWSIFVLPLEKEFDGHARNVLGLHDRWFRLGLSFIAAGRLQDKKDVRIRRRIGLFSLGWVLRLRKDVLSVSHDGK